MRHWNRSATNLGVGIDDSIQKELTLRFPIDEYPVNIDVVGVASASHGVVKITNFELGIELSEKAHPEDFVEAGATTAAVIATVERLISQLLESGMLRLSEMR